MATGGRVAVRDPDEQWRMQYIQQAGWKPGATVAASTLLDQFLVKREKAHQTIVAEVKAQREALPVSEWVAQRSFNLTPPKGAVRDARWYWVLLRSWVLKTDFITAYVPPALTTSPLGQNSEGRRGRRRANARPPPPQPEPLPAGATLQAQYYHLVQYRDALRAYLEYEAPSAAGALNRSETSATPSPYDSGDARRRSVGGQRFSFMRRLRESALRDVTEMQGGILDEDGMVLAARREVELLVAAVDRLNNATHVEVERRVDMPAEEKFQRRLWYGQRLRDGAYTVDSLKDQVSTFEMERLQKASLDSAVTYQSPHRETRPHKRPHSNAPVVVEERAPTSMSFASHDGRLTPMSRASPAPYSPTRSPSHTSSSGTHFTAPAAVGGASASVGFVARRMPTLVRKSMAATTTSKSISKPQLNQRPASSSQQRRGRGEKQLPAESTSLDDAIRVIPTVVPHRGALLVVAEHNVADFSFLGLTHPAEILVLRPHDAVVKPITTTKIERPGTATGNMTRSQKSSSSPSPAVVSSQPAVNWKLYDFGVAHNTVAQVNMASRNAAQHSTSGGGEVDRRSSDNRQATPSLHTVENQGMSSSMTLAATRQAQQADERLMRVMNDVHRGRLLLPDGTAPLPVIPCEVLKLNNNQLCNTRSVYAMSASWGSPTLTTISAFEYFGLVMRRRFGEAALSRIQLLDLSENRLVAVPIEIAELVALTGLRMHGNLLSDLSSVEAIAQETALPTTLTSITLHGNPFVDSVGGATGYHGRLKVMFPTLKRIDGRLLLEDE